MPPSPDVGQRGFILRYASRRALDADHAAYLTHGGMIVPIPSESAPPPNAAVELRIEGPDGIRFVIAGRSGNFVPGRGLMVSFLDPTQQALDDLVEGPAFKAALSAEAAVELVPPTIETYEVSAEIATDPTLTAPSDPFDDPTPIDPRAGAPDSHPPLAADPIAAAVRREEGTELHPDVLRRRRRPAPSADRPPTVVRTPRGGEEYQVVVVKLYAVADYLSMFAKFFTTAEIELPYPNAGFSRGQVALLRLTLPGHNVFEMWAVIEMADNRRFCLRVRDNDDAYRKAILYPESVAAKARLQREQQNEDPRTEPSIVVFAETKAEEDESKMPLRRRLARMGMDDKINLALSGNREERMALAMDSNKAVHHYLLKNAKLTLDEVAHMARLPSLNPDVLDKIAENPSYTQNPTVTKALVFNPRTPVRTAIRLLDRLPRNELVNLSKRMSMNSRLVMAAKNKLFKIK